MDFPNIIRNTNVCKVRFSGFTCVYEFAGGNYKRYLPLISLEVCSPLFRQSLANGCSREIRKVTNSKLRVTKFQFSTNNKETRFRAE